MIWTESQAGITGHMMVETNKFSWERKPRAWLNRAADILFLPHINELFLASSSSSLTTSYTLFLHPICGCVVLMHALQTYLKYTVHLKSKYSWCIDFYRCKDKHNNSEKMGNYLVQKVCIKLFFIYILNNVFIVLIIYIFIY